MLKPPNVLLVEVPPQFIALCETTGVSPRPPCAAWPRWSVACNTMKTTGWCRWRARRREACPGAGCPAPGSFRHRRSVR